MKIPVGNCNPAAFVYSIRCICVEFNLGLYYIYNNSFDKSLCMKVARKVTAIPKRLPPF
jgi:hypothetical protein